MIMRDGEFSTLIQQQVEDKVQKSMEKEQRGMKSTPTGKSLLLVKHVPSLYRFLKSSIPKNLDVASKLTTLAMESMSFFTNCLLHLQAIFRVTGKLHCGYRLALQKFVIDRDDLNQ